METVSNLCDLSLVVKQFWKRQGRSNLNIGKGDEMQQYHSNQTVALFIKCEMFVYYK